MNKEAWWRPALRFGESSSAIYTVQGIPLHEPEMF